MQRFTSSYTDEFCLFKNVSGFTFSKEVEKESRLVYSFTNLYIDSLDFYGKLLDIRLCCLLGTTKVNKTWLQPSRGLLSTRGAKQVKK